uniref:Reverse transcriptase domain-containing protein n=1 Tax=Xenopus tropicalis TaxID=8364 RepID=A0A803JPB3_XENTR
MWVSSHQPNLRICSDFYPVHCRGNVIDTFQDLVEDNLLSLKAEVDSKFSPSNLTKMEQIALEQLRNDHSLVIKNADKGGMVVVLDSETYKNEALRQLSDVSTYQILKGNPTVSYTNILVSLVDGAFRDGLINDKVRDYLVPKSPKIPLFHHLPKVHKIERPLVGRPIVSGIASLNERLSEYVDLYLQPLVQRLISYVRDTKHILQLLSGFRWQSDYSWGTIDVASLYSCIPHDRGLEAVLYHLDMYSTYDSTTKAFILDSIAYLLSHNFFKFDGAYYLQKCGTSMGAKFAPTYANLYMGWWEETHIYGGNMDSLRSIIFYKRYVDDLLLVWQGSELDFSDFVSSLNENSLNLRFTSDFNQTSIAFLDLKLVASGHSIETTTFRKACAGNSLLRADSCHPQHLFKGIPLGQFYRIRRNCSTMDAYLEQACHLRDRFLDRGYSMKSLLMAFTKALYTKRSDLLKGKDSQKNRSHLEGLKKKTERRVKKSKNKSITNDKLMNKDLEMPVFVTTYTNQFYRIRKIFNNLLPVLYNDPLLATVLQGGCKFVARKALTLGNVLSPTLWQSKPTKTTWLSTQGTYPCGARRCVTCTYIKRSTSFRSSVSKKSFEMRMYANCNTQYVIYLLTCLHCDIQYVGCTTRSLKSRMREHIRHIVSKDSNSPVSRHFIQCCDSNVSCLQIQVIDRVSPDERGSDMLERLLRLEVKWIFLLGTRHPGGLNSVFDVSCYV